VAISEGAARLSIDPRELWNVCGGNPQSEAVPFRRRATQGSSKPGSRSAFWSKVKVQEQPALVPSAAMTASANEPCPSLPVVGFVSFNEEAEQLLCTAILRPGMLPDPPGLSKVWGVFAGKKWACPLSVSRAGNGRDGLQHFVPLVCGAEFS
jgi:hypothetical protein